MPAREFYRWQVSSFTVHLALDVVERLSEQLQSPRMKPAEEHGGILYGRVLQGNSVEIDGFEFIRSKHYRGAPYDLSLSERRGFERRIRSLARREGLRPIGFFRTHLRPGLFLDQSDFALLTEAFSGGPGIALAIRMTEPTEPSAGIFFREGGDIDRSRTKLMFPFDAGLLRAQGPIEIDESVPALPPRMPARIFRARPAWLVGLAGGLAGSILTFAALSAFHQSNNRLAVPVSPMSVPRTEFGGSAISPFSEASQPTLEAPPADFDDTQSDDIATGAALARKPQAVTPLPLLPPPASVEPLVPVTRDTSPPPPAAPAAAISSPAPAPTPAVKGRRITVDINVEPKEGPMLKRVAGRVAGHVPFLGRLRHHNDTVSPRPAANLVPPIPAQVSRDLDDEVRVDVEASIDDTGMVRDAEVTQGAGTEFGPLAAERVRSIAWQPARSGDRNVPMDVIVHYRFNPAPE